MRRILSLALALGLTASVSFAGQVVGRAVGPRPPANRQGKGWQIAPEMPRSLKQALSAFGTLRYAGTRVIETKVGPNRHRHTEFVITDGARSRIEFPQDSPLHGQVIVETPQDRKQFNPVRNEVAVLPPRREEAFGRIALMVARRNVRVTETNGGQIASIATSLVSMADRQNNVLQRLWIEPMSGMILKREIYDKTGALTGSFEFTQIDLHPIIRPTDFSMPKGVPIVTPEDVLRRLVRRGNFQFVRIPLDLPYRLEGSRIQKLAAQDVLVQAYAGNGKRITLFQVKAPVDPARLGKLERPDLQIYAWQAGGSSFVLVGDLSDAELRDLGHRLGG